MEDPTSEEMVDWFRNRFEDPANVLYHGNGEDGYEWGGYTPYYPPDVLEREFSNADRTERKEATRELERTAAHWVKKSEMH